MGEGLSNGRGASIYAVAAAAGVSKSTVSRVINNDSKVSPATVLAVRGAIERLDYQPTPVKSRRGPRTKLRKSIRRKQLALLFGGLPLHRHTPVYSRVFQGVEERLSEENWNLVVRYLPDKRPWEAIPHRLDGIILFNVGNGCARLTRELRRGAAVRIMGVPWDDDFFDHVTYDDNLVGERAAAYLLERGHSKLACVTGGGWRRSASFLRAVREAEVDVVEITPSRNLIDEGGKVQIPNREVLAEVAVEISRMTPRPGAIYVGADIVAVGLHHALLASGLKPGVDIEIVGTNNDAAHLNYLMPRPASVDIHAEEVGRRGIEQLLWRLDNPREPRQIIQLEPEIALK